MFGHLEEMYGEKVAKHVVILLFAAVCSSVIFLFFFFFLKYYIVKIKFNSRKIKEI